LKTPGGPDGTIEEDLRRMEELKNELKGIVAKSDPRDVTAKIKAIEHYEEANLRSTRISDSNDDEAEKQAVDLIKDMDHYLKNNRWAIHSESAGHDRATPCPTPTSSVYPDGPASSPEIPFSDDEEQLEDNNNSSGGGGDNSEGGSGPSNNSGGSGPSNNSSGVGIIQKVVQVILIIQVVQALLITLAKAQEVPQGGVHNPVQTPTEFVQELQDSEMPSIFGSDGGD
jgi:hypothetical protein